MSKGPRLFTRLLEDISTYVMGAGAPTARHRKTIMVETAKGSLSNWWVTPQNITSFFVWYETDGSLRSMLNSLAESSVGLGFFTQMPSSFEIAEDEFGEPITPVQKELVDEFNRVQNMDHLLPNITRLMLTAGFVFVDTRINKFPIKSKLKIIHPDTVKKINQFSDGSLKSIVQEVKNEQGMTKQITIPAKFLTHFIHNQQANDLRGLSIVKSVEILLSAKLSAITNMDGIIRRYLAPKLIWMASQDVTPIKEAVEDVQADEDIFIGNIEFGKDDLGEFKVMPVAVDGRARFWEFIQYIDMLIWEGINGPSQQYWRNATQASATVLQEVVDRNIGAIQRNIKRGIERGFYDRLLVANDFNVIEENQTPRITWGVEKTGVEDINLADFLSVGVNIGYIGMEKYWELLNVLGVPVKAPAASRQVPEEEPVEEPEEPVEEPDDDGEEPNEDET